MVSKNAKWTEDVVKLCGELKTSIKGARDEHAAAQTRGAKQNSSNRMYLYYRKMLNMYFEKAGLNFNFNKQYFVKAHRKDYKALTMFIANTSPKLADPKYIERNKISQSDVEAFKKLEKDYAAALSKLSTSNTNYYNLLREQYKNCSSELGGELIMTKDNKDDLQEKTDTLILMFQDNMNKLKSLYNQNYSAMDLVDSQFIVLYVIKGLRILFTYIALFLTTRVFSPIYEEAVYDKKSDPPSLAKFLMIFLAFDISFNVFLLVVLFLLKFLFKSDDNSFVIDNYLFSKYITDYVFSMLILVAAGYMISKVMMDKKYFKYKYEGLRAVRAFESVLFNTCIVVYLIPFFWMI